MGPLILFLVHKSFEAYKSVIPCADRHARAVDELIRARNHAHDGKDEDAQGQDEPHKSRDAFLALGVRMLVAWEALAAPAAAWA